MFIVIVGKSVNPLPSEETITLCIEPFSEPLNVSSSKINPSVFVEPLSLVMSVSFVITLSPAFVLLTSVPSNNRKLTASPKTLICAPFAGV